MITGNALAFRTGEERDFEALVALRTRAMRASLERIGRFDPDRVRDRLRSTFEPMHMRVAVSGDAIIGCVTVRPGGPKAAWIEHFYLEPSHQGRGLGATMMSDIARWADHDGVVLRLSVLKESDANRFYVRYGFVETHREAWDIYYERQPAR
ncbi:GNAT family N-acetyltransferase [Phenylobacterium kunshanense]|uniref:GNAT family N-acetyltransferase n=1 Tax=Phenylobacterium kunshanense TaxID=1445034 RepID=A0A328B554_9CAUL|nr:GNAT family N-acetyltransferase [Phenylobacterium kunshanense]RAK62542.1 GNAT family N-acetyltransferase [Phenylobacterium kunshanense]